MRTRCALSDCKRRSFMNSLTLLVILAVVVVCAVVFVLYSRSGKKRMDRRIKFICPFDLAEHQGVEPWHRSPGLSHFEFFLLHGTWWKIEVVSRTYQKIRTIEFTLKISSKSKITRLHADLNPLSKTQKNLPFGENWERFYALWRERAREIPGARIHPYNMLLLTLTKSKQQRMDEHEDSVRVL